MREEKYIERDGGRVKVRTRSLLPHNRKLTFFLFHHQHKIKQRHNQMKMLLLEIEIVKYLHRAI